MNIKKNIFLKGCNPLVGINIEKFNKISDTFKKHFSFLNQIIFPLINKKEIFQKDFLNHFEFFLLDNNENILSPEYTALYKEIYLNQSIFYIQPCFRKENTQNARWREFYQAGVEIPIEKEYLINFCIKKLILFLNELEINFKIYYNLIPSLKKRINFDKSLLCEKCRFKALNKTNSMDFIECECNNLKNDIDFEKSKFIDINNMILDKKLFRGLGYYENFIFQIHSDGLEIGGGGCYQGGFGFAVGIYRIMKILNLKTNIFQIIFRPKSNINIFELFDILNKNNINFKINNLISDEYDNIIIEKNKFVLRLINFKKQFVFNNIKDLIYHVTKK